MKIKEIKQTSIFKYNLKKAASLTISSEEK